jgi:YD repeat-containing protein
LLSQTDQLGRTTSFTYDGLGRRTSVIDPLDNVTSFSFDAVGKLLAVTDPLQQVTQYAYDNLYRRTSTTDALGGVTNFAYDAVGNLLSLTDPVNNTTSWVYDALNRVAEETNQLSFTRYFVYDAVGNLTRRTDRNGRGIEYTYDNLSRRTQENWLDEYETTERTLAFSFDAAGQLVEAADPAAAYSYTHDNLGRIVSIGQTYAGLSVPVQFTQQFDAVGNRTQFAATIGGTADFVNDYQFDALRRMTRVTQHDVGYASSSPASRATPIWPPPCWSPPARSITTQTRDSRHWPTHALTIRRSTPTPGRTIH